jgi:hypothetical protein
VEGVGWYVDEIPLHNRPLLITDLHLPPSPHDDVDLLRGVAVRALPRSRRDVDPRHRQPGLGETIALQQDARDQPIPLSPRRLRYVPLEHHTLLASSQPYHLLIVDNCMLNINIDS